VRALRPPRGVSGRAQGARAMPGAHSRAHGGDPATARKRDDPPRPGAFDGVRCVRDRAPGPRSDDVSHAVPRDRRHRHLVSRSPGGGRRAEPAVSARDRRHGDRLAAPRDPGRRAGLVALGALRGGSVRRPRVRRVQCSLPERDDGVGRLAISRDRDLHRRRELRLRAAEPELHLARQRGRRRVAHDPDLRGLAGAEQLVRLCRDLGRPGLGTGHRSRNRCRRRRAGHRDSGRQPHLQRHGGVFADDRQHLGGACVPVGMDGAAARRGLSVGRLQQLGLRRLGPRRAVRHDLPRARRHLVCRME
jgi:hypothetical protein